MEVTDERHLSYLIARGVQPSLPSYATDGDHLLIRYRDHEGNSYLDCQGRPYVVHRLFPTGKPKFKAPPCSGSRPYFSPLMPPGQLNDIRVPLVLIEGPVKVDALYSAGITGFCFVGLTGTWNIRDRRDENGTWNEENDTRLLPELKAIPMRSRQVICLFDSDIEDNISVDAAAKAVGNMARSQGGRPFRCLLPSETDGQKNGADDYVVRHGAEALVERLEEAEIEGWPLPASLLDKDGELKRSYGPTEEKRLLKAAAQITDAFALDKLIRSLYRRLGLSKAELLALIEDVRDGIGDRGLFFDPAELDTPDIDNRWIVPGILAYGEAIILSGLGGTSKTFFAYGIGSACRRGVPFLGMKTPKLRVCILQLEEGASFGSRMEMFGFQKSEIGQTWNAIRNFNPLKPTHMQMLKSQVLPHYDLFILDSIREMSAGSGLNENQAEFSQRLIRPLVKLFRGTRKGLVAIDHNSKGTNAIAGNEDKRAAVWGVFNMKKVSERSDSEVTISSIQAHGGKARDSESIFWELHWSINDEPSPGQDKLQWRLVGNLKADCTDLNIRNRVLALLERAERPLTLGEIADQLALPSDHDGKVHGALRKLASRDSAVRRYRDGSQRPAVFWMEPEERSVPVFPLHPQENTVKLEPSSDTSGFKGSNGVPPENRPCHTNGSAGSTEVPPNESLGNLRFHKAEMEPNGNPENACNDSLVPLAAKNEAGGTSLFHNSVSTVPNPVSLRLNGHRQQVLDLIAANPGLIASQYANKIQVAFGIPLSGQQVKALMEEQRQNTT